LVLASRLLIGVSATFRERFALSIVFPTSAVRSSSQCEVGVQQQTKIWRIASCRCSPRGASNVSAAFERLRAREVLPLFDFGVPKNVPKLFTLAAYLRYLHAFKPIEI
jgi:hypothetical protein